MSFDRFLINFFVFFTSQKESNLKDSRGLAREKDQKGIEKLLK